MSWDEPIQRIIIINIEIKKNSNPMIITQPKLLLSSTSTWNVVLTSVKGPIIKNPSTAMKIRQLLAKTEVNSKYGVI